MRQRVEVGLAEGAGTPQVVALALVHAEPAQRLDVRLALEPLGDDVELEGRREARERARELDRLLPARLTIPTGRRVAIDYTAEGGPVLAGKLQSLFGWTETPRLADGRVALTIHLLSPAGRPLAITADLASFWSNAYPEVRKDMRGRYPKHPWPEDPLSARPREGTGRK